MDIPPKSTFLRYLALDLHKHYLVVAGVNFRQEIVLNPRRISLEKWNAWAKANLLPTDALVIEATTNAWNIYDQVRPIGGKGGCCSSSDGQVDRRSSGKDRSP